MEFLTFALAYIVCTALFLFVLLFGESPLFRGTPISQLHYFLTAGCCDGLEWGVGKLFGQKGVKALDSTVECCCQRSNPTLQIVYLVLMSGSYYCYQETVFQLLPNPFVGAHHMYIGTLLSGLSLTMFAVACLSDPGAITKDNVDVHTALYPFDDVIWPEKDCWTCQFPRPARSKHCPVCNCCVARFDHHCGWINNCVGLSNHRYFLGFLAANQVMCLYGSLLAAATLYGEILAHGLHTASILDHATGKVVPLMSRPSRVVQWVVVMYPFPTMLSLFLLVATLLLGSFTAYQMLLVARGRTTYETFRWSDLYNAMLDEAEAGQPPRSRLRKLWDSLSCQGPLVNLPNNIYHKGLWENLGDILFPNARLAAVRRSTSRSSGMEQRQKSTSTLPSSEGGTSGQGMPEPQEGEGLSKGSGRAGGKKNSKKLGDRSTAGGAKAGKSKDV